MRRRGEGGVPVELLIFDPLEWPAVDGHSVWVEARERWRDEHGWPNGEWGWAAAEIAHAAATPDEPWNPYEDEVGS